MERLPIEIIRLTVGKLIIPLYWLRNQRIEV